MGYSNKLTQMARELLNIEADLPYRFDYSTERPTIDSFTLYTFEQLWSDTTCGFGGIGGQAFTSARIYVFVPIIGNQKCFIYIGDKFAYKADWCDALKEDIDNHNIESVARSSRYRKD
jgi:hypothetical protein